jgi:DNA-binding transcriptional MocR family regulator
MHCAHTHTHNPSTAFLALIPNMTDVSDTERLKAKIDLHRGWPNTTLLPSSSLQLAAATVLSNPDLYVSGLLYGPNLGDSRLRRSIATWLTGVFSPETAINPERICITGGASQNLGSLLQVFSDPGYTLNVWLIVPCYMLACRIIEDAGFTGKLRSVPEDAEGLDLAYLEDELTKAEADAKLKGHATKLHKADRPYRKSYRHIIYTVPTFSNPSSTLMTLRRREGLVRLARRFDALVICDDVYDFLHWPVDKSLNDYRSNKAVMPRLVDVDRFLDGGTDRSGADGFGNVASNGTFSKIVAPGLRCGWVEGTCSLSFGLSEA